MNPLSRTSQTADITIVDNVIRGMKELLRVSNNFSKKKMNNKLKFNNKKNLANTILEIKNNLSRRLPNA